jgi:hypothetical protein
MCFVESYVAVSLFSLLFLCGLLTPASGQLSVARSHLIACSVGSKMIVGGGSVNGYPSNAIDLYVHFVSLRFLFIFQTTYTWLLFSFVNQI